MLKFKMPTGMIPTEIVTCPICHRFINLKTTNVCFGCGEIYLIEDLNDFNFGNSQFIPHVKESINEKKQLSSDHESNNKKNNNRLIDRLEKNQNFSIRDKVKDRFSLNKSKRKNQTRNNTRNNDFDLNEQFKKALKLSINGNLDLAMEKYQKILKTKPDHVNSLIALGLSYLKKGDSHQALLEWKKVIEFDPENDFVKKLMYKNHLNMDTLKNE